MESFTDDLLRSILARLPVRDVARMRIVCKRWKDLLPLGDALQIIDPNFSVNSITAFLIQLYWGPQYQEAWVIELAHGRGLDINIYKSPCPEGRIIVDTCRSICFCMRNEDRLDLSICNPATRTWRQLPRPTHNDPNWHFRAMTFDPTLRRCTVLLGYNNVHERGGNLMGLEIYDSESNAWTRVSMKAPRFIQPRGKGLYSNGKFHWIIKWNAMYFLVALGIAERSWTEIRLPEVCRSICDYPASLYLSGCDGGVVLIRYGEERGDIRMWRSNGGGEWREDEIWRPEGHENLCVVANNGWVMIDTIVGSQIVIYLCNLEQKTTYKIPFRCRNNLSFTVNFRQSTDGSLYRRFVAFDFSKASCSACCQNEDCLRAMEKSVTSGDALQRIDPNFSVNSITAFLIQLYWGPQYREAWVIELAHGAGSDINIYKSPCPEGRIIVDACPSICFCLRSEDRLDLSLCNPATRTWRQLPCPAHNDPNWDFNAMTFDPTLRRCTVLLGYNVHEQSENLVVLEIYDSESNAWTRVSMKAPHFIVPSGKGLHSNGKFHWIIKWNAMYFLVALGIAERNWTEITLPEVCRSICHYPASLYLSGCDGGVVLIRYGEERGDIRMWRSNGGGEWREDEIWRPECHENLCVVANNGWVMIDTIVGSQIVIYLCNLEQKTTYKIPFRYTGYSRFFHSSFESNNVWWPCAVKGFNLVIALL